MLFELRHWSSAPKFRLKLRPPAPWLFSLQILESLSLHNQMRQFLNILSIYNYIYVYIYIDRLMDLSLVLLFWRTLTDDLTDSQNLMDELMSPSFIYLSIYPCVHSFLHPFLPTSHLAVYDSIFREITRSSALGRSKLRCPAGKVWMVSPQFSIN